MIGVFDSGHGGLTILRAVAARLPDQDLLYLGDHAHAPYGERSPEDIHALTVANVERLFGLGCGLVLLACNTAAAVALRRLQQGWLARAHPDRRVLGVLVPMVEAVTKVPWHVQSPPPGAPEEPETVAVFATRRTADSGAYPHEVGKRAPAIRVVQQACPDLVAHIEAGAPDPVLRRMVAGFVAALRARLGGGVPDSVILGCTHYPLVAPLFRDALPAGVRILEQPAVVAESLADYLARHPRFAGAASGRTTLYTTGDPARASALASRFCGQEVAFDALPGTAAPKSQAG